MSENSKKEEEIFRKSAQRRMKELHTHSYLTLLSIGQAVAFSLLCEKISLIPSMFKLGTGFPINIWLLTLETFFLLILVWNDYYMVISCFTWIPTLLDAIIPFGLFAAEAFLSKSVDNPSNWFISLSLFCFCSLIAFSNTIKQSGSVADNAIMFKINRKRMYTSAIIVGILIPVTLIMAFLAFKFSIMALICSIFSLLCILIFSYISIFNWRNVTSFIENKEIKI